MIRRAEQETDHEAARQVNLSAFETQGEAILIEALREQAESLISLVAEEEGNTSTKIADAVNRVLDHASSQ